MGVQGRLVAHRVAVGLERVLAPLTGPALAATTHGASLALEIRRPR